MWARCCQCSITVTSASQRMNPAVTKERRSLPGAMSYSSWGGHRAVTSVPIASGSSSASVDKSISQCWCLYRCWGGPRTVPRQILPGEGSLFQRVATDMSLGPCTLPAKSTCTKIRSVSVWITADDYLGPAFVWTIFFSFYLCGSLWKSGKTLKRMEVRENLEKDGSQEKPWKGWKSGKTLKRMEVRENLEKELTIFQSWKLREFSGPKTLSWLWWLLKGQKGVSLLASRAVTDSTSW